MSACTRERQPWPEDSSSPETEPNTVLATITPAGPDATVFPVFTPHITAEPSGDEGNETDTAGGIIDDAQAPVVTRNLPPMPDTKELTPKPPTPTPGPDLFPYKVQAGDNLYAIAEKFKTTVADIKLYNNLEDPNNLRSGTILMVPGEPPTGAETSEGYVHIVKPGETLFGIAMQYGVPLNELAQTNNITDPATLRTGQRLIIPNMAEQQGTRNEARVHVVQPGETLTSIAAKYGVAPSAILKANDLDNPNRIYSGQKLVIPN